MSKPFRVGEIVIGQNFIHQTFRNEMECEVIAGLALCTTIGTTSGKMMTGMRYEVMWADGTSTFQSPINLRRRKPPQSDSHERTYMEKWRDMAGKAPQREGVPA